MWYRRMLLVFIMENACTSLLFEIICESKNTTTEMMVEEEVTSSALVLLFEDIMGTVVLDDGKKKIMGEFCYYFLLCTIWYIWYAEQAHHTHGSPKKCEKVYVHFFNQSSNEVFHSFTINESYYYNYHRYCHH